MPVVPQYQPNVQDRPIFQQGLTARASPDDMGAAIGRGMQGFAAGVDQLGDAFARVKELEDIANAKERDNLLADWDREAKYGEGGFMTLEGKAAVDGHADYEKRLEEKRRELGKDLSPSAQQMYSRTSQARVNSSLDQAIVHQANGRKKWFADASTARVAIFAEDALASYGNPALVNKNIAAGQAELRQQAELMGWDNDVLKLKEAEFISGVHKNITLRLAQDDPIAAERYITENSAGMAERDKMALRNSLETPLLAAKGERNAAAIIGGVASQDYAAPARTSDEIERRPLPAPASGPMKFNEVASKMVGLHERGDNAVISDFIKRSAGIDIDPKLTPWCAAFVNGVLGAAGVEGTGKLNARSFLNFGSPTDNPRMGDVVVLSRGTGGQGHVGFFQGFDAAGNIVVLGGNQGNKVSVATYSADKLLGFRRAGPVTENTAKLPNYTPAGLSDISARLSAIKDPKERKATQEALNSYYILQKKAMDASKDQAQSWAETQIMQNPTFDPMKMPLEVQTVIGASGMTTLLNYQEKVRTSGQPVTDENVLYDLQTMYATDPSSFADLDLRQYRPNLSDADNKIVNGWRQTALTDERKAREEGLTLTTAFSQATTQLQAIGIETTGKKKDAEKIAQFNNVLARQMQEFKEAEKRNPTQVDIQTMINRLLLPIVVEEEKSMWNPTKFPWASTTTRDGLLFEAGSVPDGMTVDVVVEYEDIPRDMRQGISTRLETELGRKPSPDEVVAEYEAFVLGQ